MTNPDNHEIVWYGGLRASEDRALEVAEQEELARLLRRLRIRGWLCVGTIPLTLILLAAITAIVDLFIRAGVFPEDLSIVALSTLAVLSIILGAPFAIANALQWFRRAKRTREDLVVGRVNICHGEPGEFAVTPQVAKQIARAGFVISEDDPLTIEVLPASATIWRINDRRADTEIIVLTRGATSTTPEFATIAAKWTRPLETLRGLIEYNRRALSDAEKKELSLYLPNLSRRVLWLVALHLLLIYQLQRFAHGEAAYAAMAIVSAVIAFFADRRMFRVVAFHRKLKRDLTEGWVLIVKPTDGEPQDEVIPLEYLPASGAEWTMDGQPSVWRKMYGRFTS